MADSVLRFLTCGSVDDGKSTLIGRLLYDTKLLFDDHVATLEQERLADGEFDFSLLLDGLQAEREQGITIDVAYRYFATQKRRFIVADTPGHEQYTRNMATGASTADLAVILVDARKGILIQTRRHTHIVSLFGIRHIVLAVNKMDLVDYGEETFDRISSDFRELLEELEFASVCCIPMSALKGDNLYQKSTQMPWYEGPTLLSHLEAIETKADLISEPFRMPVQWVNRPDADFRGYSGTVVSGQIRPGDQVAVVPSDRRARVDRIVTADGDCPLASVGDAVTLTMREEVDVSRGDVLSAPDAASEASDQFRVKMLWMDAEPMLPGRSYEIKIGTQVTTAAISDLRYMINVDTMEHVAARTLALNEIGICNLTLSRAVAYDSYSANRQTGCFILIDRYTKHTVAAGTIEFGLRRATNIVHQNFEVDQAARAELKNQKPCILWFTGLSGSGKSTIANRVEMQLLALGHHTQTLDGDNIRHGLNRDLGFTDADRVENIRRIAEVSKLFVEAGLIVLVSFISPFRSERKMARDLVAEGEFIEIFVDTPLNVCEARDPKGLYEKARAGEVVNFTGIDSPYEPPNAPDLRIETVKFSEDEAADMLIRFLRQRKVI